MSTAEMHSITLAELKQVCDEAMKLCRQHRWKGVRPQKTADGKEEFVEVDLEPETINLYDLKSNFILEKTRERLCSYAEFLHKPGWAGVKPAWFVSHWWGMSILLFTRCIEQHAADHGLSDDTPYWICAYAINQHASDEVSVLDGGDVASTAFVKAVELAGQQVLTVVDGSGMTYSRAWCCLEISRGLGANGTYEVYTPQDGGEAYDHTQYDAVVAELRRVPGRTAPPSMPEIIAKLPIVKDRRAVGLTSGPCGRWGSARDGADLGLALLQAKRQASFPVQLLHEASRLQVQAAQAIAIDCH